MYPDYDAETDFAASIALCYEVIRKRVADGGPTWRPRVTNQGFTPGPFPQLQQQTEKTQEIIDNVKKRGGRRGPRPPKAAKAKPAKKPRKIGKAKELAAPYSKATASTAADPYAAMAGKRAKKPRALKVDLALAMSALSGLSEDDAKVVHSFVQALAPFSKKARERICGALVKVVG